MAEWVIPVELETGIPLSIAPRYDIPRKIISIPGEFDNHHPISPANRESLQSGSGLAVRQSREQFVEYHEHRTFHYYFDEYMTNEWDIPSDENDRFGMVILLAAGYIPPVAIRSRRVGPEYVQLTDLKREFLWKSHQIKVSSPDVVYGFIHKFIASQQIEVDDIILDEFLHSTNEDVIHQIGQALLEIAVESATDQVRSQYLAAYQKKLIKPELPPDPGEFVLKHEKLLGTQKRKRKTRTDLRQQLAKSRGVELPLAA